MNRSVTIEAPQSLLSIKKEFKKKSQTKEKQPIKHLKAAK